MMAQFRLRLEPLKLHALQKILKEYLCIKIAITNKYNLQLTNSPVSVLTHANDTVINAIRLVAGFVLAVFHRRL